MHKLTFFPLGNADSYLVELANGQKLLFDYADVPGSESEDDLRIDLPEALRGVLGDKTSLDVVAFTHADDDHTRGAEDFFSFEHADKYQGDNRVKIEELWVPATFIVEPASELRPSARVVQAEARYRLKAGRGIRVFSRPAKLDDWLSDRGIRLADRSDVITDAGKLVPNFEKSTNGVEFFVHSPFAERTDDSIIDRNDCSMVLQATFDVAGSETRALFTADTTWENFVPMIKVTEYHENDYRLRWDVFKLPHHCSSFSLSSEKGDDVTQPVDEIKWLFEEQGSAGSIMVSTSDAIPTVDTVQPPHCQAAAYYRQVMKAKQGEFKVTMEHPTERKPEPLVIIIDGQGARVEKQIASGVTVVTSRPSPRVG